MLNKRTTWSLCVGFLALVGTSGCNTTSYALAEKDNEIRELREERTRLKKERESLTEQVRSLESQLADANSRVTAEPVDAGARIPDMSDLDAIGVDWGVRDGRMVISLPSAITFGSGSAALSNEGRSALQTVARTLQREYPGDRYFIEGHTDTDPISKSRFESNRALSLARAMAVLTYLVEDCGLTDDACVVVGHGQYDPVATNDSEDGKARNRRVEIVVHPASS